MQKYGFDDARPVLERASARETAARVALGAVAQAFLRQALGVRLVATSSRSARSRCRTGRCRGRTTSAASTPTRCAASTRHAARDGRRDRRGRKDGDTLGGVVEVLAHGLPPGLGSHVHWDRGSTRGWPRR
jgi:chorismate synthase